MIHIIMGFEEDHAVIRSISPSLKVVSPSESDIEVAVYGPHESIGDWLHNVFAFWEPRVYHYYVKITNKSNRNWVGIAGIMSMFPQDRCVIRKIGVDKPPESYHGAFGEAYTKLKKIALSEYKYLSYAENLLNLFGAAATWGTDTAKELFANAVAKSTWSIVKSFIVKEDIKDFYPAVSYVVYKDMRALAVLQPGESITLDVEVVEVTRGSGSGYSPQFIVAYYEVERVVVVEGWPFLNMWVDFQIHHDWSGFTEDDIHTIVKKGNTIP